MITLHMEKSGERSQASRKTSSCVEELGSNSYNNMHVPADHLVLKWLPRHGANCLMRYRIGEDRKTAEQRRTRNRWLKPALEFGERINGEASSRPFDATIRSFNLE